MAIRFRKSVKIAPGIRLTAGKKGLGVGIGPRGGGVHFGPNGTRVRASIPGTGISYSERVSGARRRQPNHNRPTQQPVHISVRVSVDSDTGKLIYSDVDGNPLPTGLERKAKRESKAAAQQLLADAEREINSEWEVLTTVHLQTPPPFEPLAFEECEFSEPEPKCPPLPRRGFWGTIIPPLGEKRERQAAQLSEEHQSKLDARKERETAHIELQRKQLIEHQDAQRGDMDAMETVLSDRLAMLEWPYETIVAFDIIGPEMIALDVDLPEIEDLPVRECSIAASGNKLNIKNLTDKKKRLIYYDHIHSIGFRLLGEVFALLPTVHWVLISTYSQRIDKATGQENDEYIYSAKVDRFTFASKNFEALDAIDPAEAFSRCELRRQATQTGIIKAIEPFSPPEPGSAESKSPIRRLVDRVDSDPRMQTLVRETLEKQKQPKD
ncbi:MAG: DUF4236 domain-containing protein [Alcanivorax sp.]